MIAIHAGNSLSEYDQAYAEVATQPPGTCPACQVAGQMTGFGNYPRNKPLEATAEALHPVPVRRWCCVATWLDRRRWTYFVGHFRMVLTIRFWLHQPRHSG